MGKKIKIDLKELQDEARRRNIEPITALYGIIHGTIDQARGNYGKPGRGKKEGTV